MQDVLARSQHDAEHGELGQGTAEIPDMLAKLAPVEWPRHHRAAALRAARRLRVIVREGQRHVEANRGPAGEEIDGLRTVGEERVDTRGIEAVAGLVAQISARLLLVLDDAPLFRERRAGNPEPAAGARGGATKARFLLD